MPLAAGALPRRHRAAVRRDLAEIFAEAEARGQAESAVMERLGPPEAYAAAVREQLGIRPVPRWIPMVLLLAAAAALGLFAWRLSAMPPPDAIGWAVTTTAIQLRGGAAPLWPLPVLAAAAAIAAVLLWRRSR